MSGTIGGGAGRLVSARTLRRTGMKGNGLPTGNEGRRRLPSAGRLLPLVAGGLGVAAVVAASSVGAAPRFQTAATPKATTTYTAAKSPSGQLAQTDPALLGRTDSKPVNVLIKYDFDATASYTGGVAGLAPTSPRV